MAKQKKTTKSSGGRGSAEAIRKRRIARALNTILTSEGSTGNKLDGRTEKRRKRLVAELVEGKGGEPLKPMDVVTHVDELLGIGETIASLKKQKVKPRKIPLDDTIIESIEEAQAAYKFRPDAWKLLGVDVDATGKVVVAGAPKGKRGPRKKPRG